MYGIFTYFTYIYHKNQANEGKYTIHGSYGPSRGATASASSRTLQVPSSQPQSESEASSEASGEAKRRRLTVVRGKVADFVGKKKGKEMEIS